MTTTNHTIGEDAANVAIGEREAPSIEYFVYDPNGGHVEFYETDTQRAKAHDDAIAEYRKDSISDGEWSLDVECIVSGVVTHKTVAVNDDGETCDYEARAALTAEKVAGIQPLTVSQAPTSQYAEGWNDCLKEANSPMTNGDFHCPACGEVMKGPTACGSCLWEADTCGYTAPQQPAQPVAQTLALTDEQIEDLQEAREILENMVRSVELDGNYSTEATCTFLRQALLCLPAAQPASGGESC